MKKITAVLLLVGFAAAPSLAGLKFVATPNQGSYNSGGAATGNLALSVDLDAMATGSIQFVTGPTLSITPITLSFVSAGGTGPVPTITGTSTNSGAGWNPVVPPTPTTFTAFQLLSPVALNAGNPSALVGQVDFSLPDINTNGMFDLVASAFALDGDDMVSQVIGKVSVVGVPEPSSFLFLGLVGSGIAGVQVWRRRKNGDVDEVAEPVEEAV